MHSTLSTAYALSTVLSHLPCGFLAFSHFIMAQTGHSYSAQFWLKSTPTLNASSSIQGKSTVGETPMLSKQW